MMACVCMYVYVCMTYLYICMYIYIYEWFLSVCIGSNTITIKAVISSELTNVGKMI